MSAELVPVYEGTINIGVGEDVEVIVGEPLEFEITAPCTSGENRCVETYYFLCIDNSWISQGQINGKCGYVAPSSPIAPSGGSPSGSSSSRNSNNECIEKWECTNWTTCIDNEQTRICTDLNNCDTINTKPTIKNICTDDTVSGEELLISQEFQELPPQNLFSRITGAVTGAIGTTGSIVAIVFLVGIAGSSIAVRQIRKKKGKKEEKTE